MLGPDLRTGEAAVWPESMQVEQVYVRVQTPTCCV